MSVPLWLRRILKHYDVPYEEHPHPLAFTASRLAQTLHITGRRVAKTVFLTAGTHPIAVVLPANCQVDLQKVSGIMGDVPLRFASEEEIAGWFKGCEPGAVPPLRLRGDESMLMDRDLAHLGQLTFAAGTLDMAVTVRFRDWYRMVKPGVGRFTTDNHRAKSAAQTVLVVEDETDTNQLFCQLLEQQGFTCHPAHQGGQAVDIAARVHPSAILLDLMLPDMTGFDMVEKLRRTGPLKRTPVVVVTALDDPAARAKGEQLGADVYLTKPFHPQTLVQEVQEALEDRTA